MQADDESVDEHDGEGFEDHPPDSRVPLKLLDVRDGQTEDKIHEHDGHVKHEEDEDDTGNPEENDGSILHNYSMFKNETLKPIKSIVL